MHGTMNVKINPFQALLVLTYIRMYIQTLLKHKHTQFWKHFGNHSHILKITKINTTHLSNTKIRRSILKQTTIYL
jgi:hypothetical protein